MTALTANDIVLVPSDQVSGYDWAPVFEIYAAVDLESILDRHDGIAIGVRNG
jgi:hypothetical protein